MTTVPGYTLHGLFHHSFIKSANNLAVEFYAKNKSTQKLSYQDVEDQSNKVKLCLKEIANSISAGFRCQNGYIHHQNCVGIYMMPNVIIPSIIIGVLKSGCKFFPLNPKSPQSIVNELARNVGITIFITTKSILSLGKLDIFEHPEIKTIKINDFINNEDVIVLYYKDKHKGINFTQSFQQFAYGISTSGTTAKPKIVNVPHQCIVPNILDLRSVFNIGSCDKIAMMAPLTFDPSIVEIFLGLSASACVVIVSDEIKLEPHYLANILFSIAKVTIVQCTPTVISRFSTTDLHSKVFSPFSSLKILALGGEAFPSCKFLNYCLKPIINSVKIIDIYNIYGITEVSSWATLHQLAWNNIKESSMESIPLGIPLYLTSLEIRDIGTDFVLCRIESCSTLSQLLVMDNLNNVMVRIFDAIDVSLNWYSCVGILFIGGRERICIDSELSVENSCHTKQKTYRNSGDVVKFTLHNIDKILPTIDLKKSFITDKNEVSINHIGRTDKQIKRHGKRINLLYLKQHLENLEIIFSAYVLYCCGKNSKQKSLVAFVCLKQNMHHNYKAFISSSCFDKLGNLYVPDYILSMNELPITLHGKVNENALTYYFSEQQAQHSFNSIQNHFLKCLLECIPSLNEDSSLGECEYLLRHSFVELGGDSFALVKFSSLLKQTVANLLDITDILLRLKLGDVLSYINNVSDEDYLKNTYLLTKDSYRYATKHKQKQITQIPCEKNGTTIFNEYYYVERTGKHSPNYINVHELACPNGINSVGDLRFSLKMQWKYNTHKCVDASPLIIGSLRDQQNTAVIIGSHSHLLSSISLVTGRVKWKTELADRIESSACLTACNQYICVGCYDGHVYSLDVETGKILWKFKTNGEVKCSPIAGINGSIIFIGSHDQHLYCLDLQNKKMIWKLDCDGGSIFSSPALEVLDDNLAIIYVCTLSGKILAINGTSGRVRWTINVGNPIFSSPLITSFGLCVGCVDYNMYMFSKANGQIIWKYATAQSVFSSPAFYGVISHNVVVFGSNDANVHCVNASNGELIWKNGNISNKSPIYASAFPFGINISKENKVISLYLLTVASIDGMLVIVNSKNGEILTNLKLPSEVFSSPVCITLQPCNDQKCLYILVGCRDDFLHCYSVVIDKI